jgi:nucleoid-associated protein YgaU
MTVRHFPRALALSGLGLAILGAAGWAWLAQGPGSAPAVRPVAAVMPTAPAAPAPPATSAPDRTAAPAALPQSLPAPDQRPALPAMVPPRFDVLRVGARGSLVAAGRAAAGAEVRLVEGGREHGRARADGRGEWVILPANPLAPGAYEFGLLARLGEGEEIAGAETVLVVVPDPAPALAAATPGRDAAPAAAARPTAAPRQAAPAAEAAPPVPAPAPAGASQAAASPSPSPTQAPASSPMPAAAPPAPPAAEAASEATAPAGPLAVLLPRSGGTPRVLQQEGKAPAAAALGLDIVDYDDQGSMRFAGSAPPHAALRLYVDGDHAGDARADEAGRWAAQPAPVPAPGRHTVRIDQLAASGQVASRVELPFQRDALPANAVRDDRVVVQPGNNLWRIARQAYGRGVRYTVIYRANRDQIRNPALIYPGQIFALPTP